MRMDVGAEKTEDNSWTSWMQSHSPAGNLHNLALQMLEAPPEGSQLRGGALGTGSTQSTFSRI